MMDIQYSLSNDTWDNAELAAIQKILDSKYFTMGEYVAEYEKLFAEKFGARYAVMSNSGSSANLLAISALIYSHRLQKGDEILVTAVSWSTTYFPLTQCGLKVRFVDIDLNTLNVDLEQLEKAVTKNTKAILAVNLLGNPNEFDRLAEICNKHQLLLIEDNCESMGAEYHGKKAGSFGILGTFSSFYSHHICTMEGGMTITNDEVLYHHMLAIRAHGWTRNLPQDSTIYAKMSDDFYESFNFIMPGYNLRPLEIEAAIGIEQLKKLDGFIAQRRKNAVYLKEQLSSMPDLQLQKEIGESSWFGFSIILQGKLRGKRDQIIALFRESGIEVRPIVAGNFTRQKALEYMDYSVASELTNADYVHENGFFVGNHSADMKKEIEYLANIMYQIT
ncbi:MAG: DegT/DnrJ/EryC1/StrS family aminotransferase [Candidatus Cloacimonadaceae bacterium]